MTDQIVVERANLLTEGNALREEARVLESADRSGEALPLRNRVIEIARRYRELLPEVTVARCPDSGVLVRWPIDTAGLDGWFWDYDTSTRRPPKDRPRRWLAMTGAMRLTEPVEYASHQAVPGPGVPFVVPRILQHSGIRAVITQVPVGVHTGWAISYFGPLPTDIGLVNLWGTDTYPVYDDEGNRLGWDRAFNTVSDYDFELGDWLRSGKLLWIAPGDDSGALREGVDGCPYVNLAGPRKIAIVEDGKVRYFDVDR
jgi:hypothetical protein